jgi:hypothetical protein
MNVPGDRKSSKCRNCEAAIVMVYTVAGKWMPCDPLPRKVDGTRVLIFNDGVTGRSHRGCEVGLEAHWKSCPNADEFREKESTKQENARVVGCGCLGGER